MPSLLYFLCTKKVVKKDYRDIICKKSFILQRVAEDVDPYGIEILFVQIYLFFAGGARGVPRNECNEFLGGEFAPLHIEGTISCRGELCSPAQTKRYLVAHCWHELNRLLPGGSSRRSRVRESA